MVAENNSEQSYTLNMSIQTAQGGQNASSSVPKKLTFASTKTDDEEEKTVIPEYTSGDFIDVGVKHWAYESIKLLREKGVVTGVDAMRYDPDGEVKREEIAVMLAKCLGIEPNDEESAFDDAKGHWASKYIAALAKDGYISGIGESEFGIGEAITREDLCTIIYRILGAEYEAVGDEPFDDEDMISDYAFEAVMYMKNMGYIVGVDNNLMPQKHLTRAEAAKILSDVFFSEK